MSARAKSVMSMYLRRAVDRVASKWGPSSPSSPADAAKVVQGPQMRVMIDTQGRGSIEVQEMPAKGKRRLRVHRFVTGYAAVQADIRIHPDEIVSNARISKSDSYEKAVSKITQALNDFWDHLLTKNVDWVSAADRVRGSDFFEASFGGESLFNFLEIEPPDTKPVVVKGKDFAFTATWGAFKIYSPSSDLDQMEPYYQLYEAKSPGAARKLYKIVKADPRALQGLSWHDLYDWFRQNKIGVNSWSSYWH